MMGQVSSVPVVQCFVLCLCLCPLKQRARHSPWPRDVDNQLQGGERKQKCKAKQAVVIYRRANPKEKGRIGVCFRFRCEGEVWTGVTLL